MTTHRYLFDEHVHSFYPTLATRIGLNEAVVLQQIHSWIQTYTKDPKQFSAKHWHDDQWWIWNSYPEWHEKLPYLSESTIRRALVHMRKLGILTVGNYNTLKIDRTYWYAIDYAAYDALMTDQDTKTESPSYQNGQMQDTNLVSPLPSISPSTSASKEPPLADSPVEDPHPDPSELCRPGLPGLLPLIDAPQPTVEDSLHVPLSRLPPQDPAFWPEGETPPEPSPQEAAEKRIERLRDELGTDPLGVAAVVVQNRAAVAYPDGGDASRDGDPWMDRPVREWCVFIGLKYKRQSIGLKRMLGDDLRKIATTGVMRKTAKTPDETGEAIRKMTKSASCKWLRSAGRPTHKEFTNVLINVLCGQVLEENGGASGGRNDTPQVDQAVAETMARLFDERGVRIRRE